MLFLGDIASGMAALLTMGLMVIIYTAGWITAFCFLLTTFFRLLKKGYNVSLYSLWILGIGVIVFILLGIFLVFGLDEIGGLNDLFFPEVFVEIIKSVGIPVLASAWLIFVWSCICLVFVDGGLLLWKRIERKRHMNDYGASPGPPDSQ